MATSAPAPSALPGVTIDNTLGAVELAVLISSVLYGVSCVQVYTYGMSCSNDRRPLRYLVAAVFILETIHLLFTWVYFYGMSVTNFGDIGNIGVIPWQFCVALAAHSVLVGLIQSFFAYRVLAVSKSFWLALPGWIGAFSRTVVTFAIAILIGLEGIQGFATKQAYMVYLTLGLSIAADVWVTTLLCYHLWVRRTGYRSTNDMITRIMTWTLETGLATTIISVLLMVFWRIMPFNRIYLAGLILYTRLYSNSLFVSLNGRAGIREGSQKTYNESMMITRSVNIEMGHVDESSSRAQSASGKAGLSTPVIAKGYAFDQYQ